MKNLLEEFAAPQKAEWLAKVEKEIKQPLQATEFDTGLFANIYVTNADKMAVSPEFRKNVDGWLISQNIKGDFNKNALEALEGGASALSFQVKTEWSQADFEANFKDIYLNFITLRIDFGKVKSQVFIDGLHQYLLSKSINANEVNIISDVNIHVTKGMNIRTEIKADAKLPLIERLADVLRRAEKMGIEKSAISIESENNFYKNIAQIKALKILSGKISEAYNQEGSAMILVDVAPTDADPNQNAIVATEQALASAVAGADLIEIANLAYDEKQYSASFGPRITRNIQNILWHESFLNRVNDASKGSYFQDELCANLMKEVWSVFIKD